MCQVSGVDHRIPSAVDLSRAERDESSSITGLPKAIPTKRRIRVMLEMPVIEWQKVYGEHKKSGKKAILFVNDGRYEELR
jgi:hypothetical protein